MATRVDVQQVKAEVKDLTDSFMEKIEKFEGQVFDIEAKTDKLEAEVKSLKKCNENLRSAIKQQDRRIKETEREHNDQQQYSSRWNLRVYWVPERKRETADNCTSKVCTIFSDKVGVPTKASEIEVVHRAGQRGRIRARPVLVRFFD